MADDYRLYHLEGEIKVVTEKAILVDYGAGEDWFPKSQMKGVDSLKKGDSIETIECREWLGKKHGLEEVD